jgi:Spermine/spermidine synthase domain
VALAFLVWFVLTVPVIVECAGSQIIFFGCAAHGLPVWAILPVIFLMAAAVMACIAQGVARSFREFEPLEAYRLDILGSLAGIVGFSLLSFLGAPPIVWGIVVCGLLVALYRPAALRFEQSAALSVTIVMLGIASLSPGDSWSPYYRITVFPLRPGVLELNVNTIPHQLIESMTERRRTEPLYFVPYRRARPNPLRDVLIVGAGNGGDVAIALAAGAKHVDAVEIDPRIYQIGREMNPDRPYQDPRVSIHIDDGRAFLERTRNRYDLILFALPDSLTLVSGQSSLRLESYLFTLEAMQAARARLTPNGAFAMYNYYRQDWLRDRLAGTLETAYGRAPCIDSMVGTGGKFSLLTVGNGASGVTCATTWRPSGIVPAPAGDDRPFLYLQTPSIPQLYLVAIAAILIASFLAVRVATGPLVQMRRYLDLFFMGAAFLLLETKNVVQFALLFGTTWFVNALVFFGILLSVYAALEVSRRVRFGHPAYLYAALFASLLVAWMVRPDSLLALEGPLRFCAAALLGFAPIFTANLIFAGRFRAVGSSTIAFGANLLGAMAGGVLEYLSLIAGYQNLLAIVALLYALAFFFSRERRETKYFGPVAGIRGL